MVCDRKKAISSETVISILKLFRKHPPPFDDIYCSNKLGQRRELIEKLHLLL